jgi:hypothetical protein
VERLLDLITSSGEIFRPGFRFHLLIFVLLSSLSSVSFDLLGRMTGPHFSSVNDAWTLCILVRQSHVRVTAYTLNGRIVALRTVSPRRLTQCDIGALLLFERQVRACRAYCDYVDGRQDVIPATSP